MDFGFWFMVKLSRGSILRGLNPKSGILFWVLVRNTCPLLWVVVFKTGVGTKLDGKDEC